MGFVNAMKTYFGLLPGQNLQQFAAELKALNAQDRIEFHQMLVNQAGIECDPPGATTVAA